jgi:hypothetical protein
MCVVATLVFEYQAVTQHVGISTSFVYTFDHWYPPRTYLYRTRACSNGIIVVIISLEISQHRDISWNQWESLWNWYEITLKYIWNYCEMPEKYLWNFSGLTDAELIYLSTQLCVDTYHCNWTWLLVLTLCLDLTLMCLHFKSDVSRLHTAFARDSVFSLASASPPDLVS